MMSMLSPRRTRSQSTATRNGSNRPKISSPTPLHPILKDSQAYFDVGPTAAAAAAGVAVPGTADLSQSPTGVAIPASLSPVDETPPPLSPLPSPLPSPPQPQPRASRPGTPTTLLGSPIPASSSTTVGEPARLALLRDPAAAAAAASATLLRRESSSPSLRESQWSAGGAGVDTAFLDFQNLHRLVELEIDFLGVSLMAERRLFLREDEVQVEDDGEPCSQSIALLSDMIVIASRDDRRAMQGSTVRVLPLASTRIERVDTEKEGRIYLWPDRSLDPVRLRFLSAETAQEWFATLEAALVENAAASEAAAAAQRRRRRAAGGGGIIGNASGAVATGNRSRLAFPARQQSLAVAVAAAAAAAAAAGSSGNVESPCPSPRLSMVGDYHGGPSLPVRRASQAFPPRPMSVSSFRSEASVLSAEWIPDHE
ncbi:hypothetical protein HK405_015255, partial [Cladochytrium tenue]